MSIVDKIRLSEHDYLQDKESAELKHEYITFIRTPAYTKVNTESI